MAGRSSGTSSTESSELATKPASAGRTSLAQQLPQGGAASPPLFADAPVWESLASSPIAAQLAGAGEQGAGEQGPGEQGAGDGAQVDGPGDGAHAPGDGDGDGAHGQGPGEQGPGKQAKPGELAEEGFRGTPVELPHRAELEKSFGASFAGVKAYTDEHARRATERLGANAYAAGDRIAFRTPNPDKALVAHELTHVLQHGGRGPAKKSEDGGDGEIDVSGEPEAERVEAAVSSGMPASGALEGGQDRGPEGGAHAATPTGASPAMSRRPALSKTKFGTGMSFRPSGFEKDFRWELWKKNPPIEIPVGAVPGLNILVEPEVVVSGGAGVDWKKKSVETKLGVQGGVGVGFSYGKSELAAVYGTMSATVDGRFRYEREKARGQIRNWELDGGFTLGTKFAVGVKLGGGIVDAKFEFGHCEIGELFGLRWENGSFDRNKIGWNWGAQPQSFFTKLRELIEKVKDILNLPKKAAKEAWKKMGGAIKGLGGIVKKIKIPDITPWDGLLPG